MRARVPHFSTTQLLISLILLFITSPMFAISHYGEPIEAIFLTIVLLSAVFAVRARRRVLAVAICLALPALIGVWVNQFHSYMLARSIIAGLAMLAVAFVMMQLFKFIVQAPRVTYDVLSAAVSAYLLLGLFWGLSYTITDQLNPRSFMITGETSAEPIRGFSAFYFSFSTLTTASFGDIMPHSSVARMLATAEAISGVFYMAILIARLVSQVSLGSSSFEPRDEKNEHRPPTSHPA